MYRSSKFVSKFEVIKCTKSWKFNLKLCTNVLIILIWWKICFPFFFFYVFIYLNRSHQMFFEAFTIRWFIQIIHFSFMELIHYSYGYIFKKTRKPFKCNNCANAKNRLCWKQWTIFMRKQWTILLNTKNRFYECNKQIRIYSKHDV